MHRAARTFALLTGLLLAVAGPAQAQVATTDLAPLTLNFLHPQGQGLNSTNIAPDNPAAVAWGTPSRIGVGGGQGDLTNNLNPTPPLNYDVRFGGFRFVGETFGVAGEAHSVKDDEGLNTTMDEGNTLQLSLALGGWLAFGIGAGSAEVDATALDPQSTGGSLDRTEGGVSLRLGEVFYLGGGAYQDDVEVIVNGVPETVERDGTVYGAALRTEGDWNWYLAYDVIDLDPVVTTSGQGNDSGLKLSSVTAQLRANWLFIGAYGGELEFADNPEAELSVKAVDLGFAPMEGLSLTARMQSADFTENDPTNTQDVTVETTSVAIAWSF